MTLSFGLPSPTCVINRRQTADPPSPLDWWRNLCMAPWYIFKEEAKGDPVKIRIGPVSIKPTSRISPILDEMLDIKPPLE